MTHNEIRFFVPGIPATAGSKRPVMTARGPRAIEDCKRSGPWRAVVQLAARQAHKAEPLSGALRFSAHFFLPRPKGHSGKRGLLPSAPEHPTTKPDTTKLLRCLEDACTGILWHDDAQIVVQHCAKRYAVEQPGVEVVVSCVDMPSPPRCGG